MLSQRGLEAFLLVTTSESVSAAASELAVGRPAVSGLARISIAMAESLGFGVLAARAGGLAPAAAAFPARLHERIARHAGEGA